MIDLKFLIMVVVMVLSSWLLGGLWYSKRVFGKAWHAEVKGANLKGKHARKVFGIAFTLWTITAFAFAYCVGPFAPFGFAVIVSLLTGICFVATSVGVNYAFSDKSLKLFLIDGGYHIVQFALYGLIVGVWHWMFPVIPRMMG